MKPDTMVKPPVLLLLLTGLLSGCASAGGTTFQERAMNTPFHVYANTNIIISECIFPAVVLPVMIPAMFCRGLCDSCLNHTDPKTTEPDPSRIIEERESQEDSEIQSK